MKFKQINQSFFLKVIALCSLTFLVTLPKFSRSPKSYDAMLEEFIQPINFTNAGLVYFIENIFNRPEYASEFLPYSFVHFLELLEGTPRTADPQIYVQQLLTIWQEKYKEVLFTDASAVLELLRELPRASKNIFTLCTYEQRKEAVRRCLYNAFIKLKTQESYLANNNNPEMVIEELTEEIMDIAEASEGLVNFLESIINKMLWSHSSKEKDTAYEIFEQLDYELFVLYEEKKLLDNNGYYRLGNSLICRLKYNIELANGDMGETFYKKALTTLEEGKLHLIAMEEFDDAILSRAQFLSYILNQGKILTKLHQSNYTTSV